jgi:hypothetical protein
MNMQENPTNGIRDAAEKTVCLSSKMPLITDCSQPNLHRLFHMHGVCSIPQIQLKNCVQQRLCHCTIRLNDKITIFVTDFTL